MADTVVVRELPQCDIHLHLHRVAGIPAAYDGATVDGPWAYMCEECFAARGIGLGTGRGQRLILRTNSNSNQGE
jgi:hypothetical protein